MPGGRVRLRLRAVQVVGEGVGAVEALAGEALLVAERPVGSAQLEVVLSRELARGHSIEHRVSAPSAREVDQLFTASGCASGCAA